MTRDERGQATLELALLLPIVATLIAAVLAAGLIAADQARVWHAAREAARVAAVDSDETTIRRAAERSGLNPLRIAISPDADERVAGRPITVDVSYSPAHRVPLLGGLFASLSLTARAAMAIEVP